MQEHPLDRATRALRPAIIVVALLSAPVMLLTYAWGLKLLYPILGPGLWAGMCLSHVICWIGISALFETPQEPPQK